jgi:hypothetical protein
LSRQEEIRVSNFVHVIKHELREAIFPTIFFFLIFHFMMITKTLILESYDMQWVSSASALIAALVVAKAILIIDVTPAGRMFRDSRLVYHVIWKTIVYSCLVAVFRYAEELIPMWTKHGSFTGANQALIEAASWPHFLAIQLWLLVSIAAFSTIVTIDQHFGPGSLRRALFSRVSGSNQDMS